MNMDDTNIQKITLVDWDDTLCPSSFLEMKLQNYARETDGESSLLDCVEEVVKQCSEEEKALLRALDETVLTLLHMCLAQAGVYIISNASMSWIEYTGRILLPRSFELICDEIPILSARDAHEKKRRDQNYQWKRVSFNSLIQAIVNEDRNATLYLLSIGDSLFERKALFSATENMHHCVPKSIKLLSRPTLSQLVQELRMIVNSFEEFSEKPEKFDLKLAVK